MAIALDRQSTLAAASTGTSLGTTFAINPTAGSKLFLWTAIGSNTNTNTIPLANITASDNAGNSYTLDASIASPANTLLFRADNIALPPSGQLTVTLSIAGTNGTMFISIGAVTFTGVQTGAPALTPASATGTSTAPSSGAYSPSGTSLVYVAAMMNQSGANITQTLNWTGGAVLFNEPSGATEQCGAMAYKIASGSQTAAWALSASETWYVALAAYAAIPPAPPGATAKQRVDQDTENWIGAGGWGPVR